MIAAGMNLIAALMALFVLKPMRRRFLQRQLAAPTRHCVQSLAFRGDAAEEGRLTRSPAPILGRVLRKRRRFGFARCRVCPDRLDCVKLTSIVSKARTIVGWLMDKRFDMSCASAISAQHRPTFHRQRSAETFSNKLILRGSSIYGILYTIHTSSSRKLHFERVR
jgi:hypothetical protein